MTPVLFGFTTFIPLKMLIIAYTYITIKVCQENEDKNLVETENTNM